jgi:uncharacterized protein (DUF1015 family)
VPAVRPFRALRYDEAKAGPLADLVAPPYDVIDAAARARLRTQSPFNVVHLTLPDDETEAARTLAEWRASGVLIEDEPAFWALQQDYVGPDGVARTRTGLAVSLTVEPYENGVVLPHERTHRGPKEGRLRLLRATRTQLEPIFLLYEAPPPFELPARDPDVGVEGTRAWRLAPDGLADAFADTPLLIADGHHRYETALAVHAEDGTPESAQILAVLVSTEDPGLTIFPTHRLALEVNGPPPTHADVAAALADLDREPRSHAAAVLYRPGKQISLVRGGERALDVELVAELAPADVSYTPSVEDALAAVDRGDAAGAFIVRPLRIEEVFERAKRGEVLPQKSTYFYPKLLSGLLLHPLA